MGECRVRVIAGSMRGRTLTAPKGHATRPTSDRVREAIFSTLQSRFDAVTDAIVLDLFAGSGALGIEALSRGAAMVTFIESSRTARDVLSRNIDDLGLRACVQVEAKDAFTTPVTLGSTSRFTLLFLDPPYRIEPVRIRELLEELACRGILEEGAVVVYEHSTAAKIVWPSGFEESGQRVYGDTTISYARWGDEGVFTE